MNLILSESQWFKNDTYMYTLGVIITKPIILMPYSPGPTVKSIH